MIVLVSLIYVNQNEARPQGQEKFCESIVQRFALPVRTIRLIKGNLGEDREIINLSGICKSLLTKNDEVLCTRKLKAS